MAKDAARERRARQQSRIPFEQLQLDPKQTLEAAPDSLARRPYWIMRLVRQTVLQGGHLTPRLYVPKGVWAQVGVKFSGFAPKVRSLTQFTPAFLRPVRGGLVG